MRSLHFFVLASRLVLFLLLVVGSAASTLSSAAWAFEHSHSGWNKLLHEQVLMEGPVSTVNYRAIRANPSELGAYLATLSAVTPEEWKAFSKDEQLSFLINAYNAFTVKLIVDHYPVTSIRDINKGLFGAKPWSLKFFKLFGEEFDLDKIEHEWIRPKYQEPRTHFALVCASISCPQLRNEAYVPAKLELQLDEQAAAFLGDHERNRYLPAEGKLLISRIFDWYGDDFKKKYGSVKSFIASRMGKTDSEKNAIASEATKVSYLDYNWKLNEKK